MSNIALQLERTLSGIVNPGNNVIFDVIRFASGNIAYNNVTGVVTFNQNGIYAINWWVATQTSFSTDGIVFRLLSSQGDIRIGDSPIKTGQVNGVGLIQVVAAPVSLQLINTSTSDVVYSSVVPLKASIMIVEVDLGATGPTGPTGATGDTGPTGATQEIPGQQVQQEIPGQQVRQEIPGQQVRQEIPGQQVRQEIPGRQVQPGRYY